MITIKETRTIAEFIFDNNMIIINTAKVLNKPPFKVYHFEFAEKNIDNTINIATQLYKTFKDFHPTVTIKKSHIELEVDNTIVMAPHKYMNNKTKYTFHYTTERKFDSCEDAMYSITKQVATEIDTYKAVGIFSDAINELKYKK